MTWKVVALLLILTFAGALFRLNQHDFPVFWHDEATTMLHISYGYMNNPDYADRIITMGELKNQCQNRTEFTNPYNIIRSIATIEPNQAPMSYLFIYLWGELFGYSIGTLKMLPMLLGVLGIPIAFWLGCELSSVSCGLLMALFVAFSPLSLHHSHELRCYPMYLLMILLTLISFLRAIRIDSGASLSSWAFYSISCVVLFYTHLSSLVIGAGIAFYACIARKINPEVVSKLALRNTLVATLFAYAAMLPWAIAFSKRLQAMTQAGAYVMSNSGTTPIWTEFAIKWLSGPASLLSYNVMGETDLPCTMTCACLVLISVALTWYFDRTKAIFLTSIFAVFVCVVYAADVIRGSQFAFYYRYILAVPVLGICFLSIALSRLLSDRRKILKLSATILACVVLACEFHSSIMEFSNRERAVVHNQNLVKLASVINSMPDALLIVTESGQFTNMNQLAALSHQVFPYVNVMWIPKANWGLIPKETTHALAFNPPKKFLEAMKERGFEIAPTEANSLFELKKRK